MFLLKLNIKNYVKISNFGIKYMVHHVSLSFLQLSYPFLACAVVFLKSEIHISLIFVSVDTAKY